MLKNVSGQFLHFDLVSVLSGFSVTGFSGAISGRKLIDSNAMALLSGNIVETSGGTYRANLFDFDTNGDDIGYFFTASGCVPRMFSVKTVGGISGRLFPASGVNATVPQASLSGVVTASGGFVQIPITLLSGVVMASGGFVQIPTALLSGVVPNVLSGTVFLASGSVTSGVINSGVFVTATATVGSGSVYLASGHFLFGSGQYFVASGSITSGVIGSGVFVSVPIASISGTNAVVPIASISGTVPNVLSGTVFLASGSIGSGTINSGVFVTATATVGSGSVYLASGHFLFGSGQYYLVSGQLVSIFSGQLSGHAVDLLSGRSFVASGINTVVPSASLSGVVANSGLFVSVPIASISGTNAVVLTASISGTNAVVLTASISGTNAVVLTASISGVVPNVLSGTVFLASGHPAHDKSGYVLTSGGLDQIRVESGMNLRQVQSVMAAALGGRLSGAGTTSIRIDGANVSGTNRIIATVDLSGNRTAVTVNLPT